MEKKQQVGNGSNAIQIFAAMVCCFLSPILGASTPHTVPATSFFGVDLQGKALQELAPAGTRVVVLYFAATDCPISNRYIPEIARLNRAYTSQGVEFLAVYPNPTDTRPLVTQHERQYGPSGEAVTDPQQSLVRLAHAQMTPEAAVMVRDGAHWREVYLGRIDDRYLSLGQERPSATRHDLENALRAALAHRPVPLPGGPAVGCAIIPLP